MTIRTFNGTSPDIDATAYVDESAVVIGNVSIGKDSSLWPLVVARGDVHSISIGQSTNIQDACVLHVTHEHEMTPGGCPLILGDWVTVGHRVTLHGCTIGDYCLIGMSATIMDGAILEDKVLVGAGSLVPPGKVLASGHLYVRSPVRRIRQLTSEELQQLAYSAKHYVKLKNTHQKNSSE